MDAPHPATPLRVQQQPPTGWVRRDLGAFSPQAGWSLHPYQHDQQQVPSEGRHPQQQQQQQQRDDGDRREPVAVSSSTSSAFPPPMVRAREAPWPRAVTVAKIVVEPFDSLDYLCEEPESVWEARQGVLVAHEALSLKRASEAGDRATLVLLSRVKAAAWAAYNAVADLEVEEARSSGRSTRGEIAELEARVKKAKAEVDRARAEVDRARAEAKIAELEAEGRDKNRGEIEQLRRAVAADKDAAAERERRLAAEAQERRLAAEARGRGSAREFVPPPLYRVRAVIADYRTNARRRFHELAEAELARYGLPKEEDSSHREGSVGWRRPEGDSPRTRGQRAQAARAGRPFSLHVNVIFEDKRSAEKFFSVLSAWHAHTLTNVPVSVDEPVRVDGIDPEGLERILKAHYVAGEAKGSPNRDDDDQGGSTVLESEPLSVSLQGDLAKHQGLDAAFMRDPQNGERNDKIHKCHLIPSPVCKKYYRNRDTVVRCPNNFVAISAQLHGLFDTWGSDADTPKFGLRFAGAVGEALRAGTSANPGARRTPVNVDVVIFTLDDGIIRRVRNRIINHEPCHVTVVNGVARTTVRLSMSPEDPAVFKECMDWKFCESLALIVRQEDANGVPRGDNRSPQDFGIDATSLRGLNSGETDELRRSASLITRDEIDEAASNLNDLE